MSPRAPSYTSFADAIALHETFVRNVGVRMRELGWVHPTSNVGGQGNGLNIARGKLDIQRLSDASGVPYRTVENLMTLSNQPTMVGAAKIAQALGVGLDVLLEVQPFAQRAPSSDGAATIFCIHANKAEGMMVCPSCLAKWQSYQQRLRALYETRREVDRAKWDDENKQVRAGQLRAANLPKDTDER